MLLHRRISAGRKATSPSSSLIDSPQPWCRRYAYLVNFAQQNRDPPQPPSTTKANMPAVFDIQYPEILPCYCGSPCYCWSSSWGRRSGRIFRGPGGPRVRVGKGEGVYLAGNERNWHRVPSKRLQYKQLSAKVKVVCKESKSGSEEHREVLVVDVDPWPKRWKADLMDRIGTFLPFPLWRNASSILGFTTRLLPRDREPLFPFPFQFHIKPYFIATFSCFLRHLFARNMFWPCSNCLINTEAFN